MERVLEAIGARIRSAREHLGLSQEELAARADVNAGYLSLIERGQREPSLSKLHKIATATNLTLGDLLGAAEVPATLVCDREVSRLMAQVPDDKRKALLDHLRTAVRLTSA